MRNVVRRRSTRYRDAISSTAGRVRREYTGRTGGTNSSGQFFSTSLVRSWRMVSARISESSFLARVGGRPLLINRVSPAVQYIHYFAPAAHLFRRPNLSILSRRPPCLLASSRERGINQRFSSKRGRSLYSSDTATEKLRPPQFVTQHITFSFALFCSLSLFLSLFISLTSWRLRALIVGAVVYTGFQLHWDISRGNDAGLTNLSRRIAMLSI